MSSWEGREIIENREQQRGKGIEFNGSPRVPTFVIHQTEDIFRGGTKKFRKTGYDELFLTIYVYIY